MNRIGRVQNLILQKPIAVFLLVITIFLSNLAYLGAETRSSQASEVNSNKSRATLLYQHVEELRTKVHEAQNDYLVSLSKPTHNILATDYLDALRNDLKRSVLEMVRIGGSEVELALKRAAVEFRLELVNNYETVFGIQMDLRTTRWNVFSSKELDTLEESLRNERTKLVEFSAKRPKSQTPSSTLGRLEEIKTELTALRLEQTMRQNGIKRPAPVITNLTLAEAEQKFPSIKMDQAARESLAEKKLLIEVEYRLAWNHDDPTLKIVRRDIRKGPYRLALIGRIDVPPEVDPWPRRRPYPKSGSPNKPSPRGPLPSPAGDSVDELVNSARAELEAVRRGDSLARAEARAQAFVHQRFIGVVTGDSVQTPQQLSLAAMSDKELQSFHEDYQRWENSLFEAKSRTVSANSFVDTELNETREWMKAIVAEQNARHPPPEVKGFHGKEQIQNALRNNGAGDLEVEAYREVAELNLEREHLAALQIENDLPRQTPDSAIDEAIETQKARLMRSEVDLLNNSLKKTNALLASNIQNGRASQGRLSAKLALDAHLMLRGQAQALQTRITSLSQKSPRAAALLAKVSLHPALLAPPPIGLTYSANRTADIVYRLLSAEGSTCPASCTTNNY